MQLAGMLIINNHLKCCGGSDNEERRRDASEKLKQYIDDRGIKVENAIGFAPWISGGEQGMNQMKEEMELLASIGGKRIVSPLIGEQLPRIC